MFKLPHQPQSIFGVFKTALIAYKETFIKILPFYLILVFVQFVSAIFLEEAAPGVKPNLIFQIISSLLDLIFPVIVIYKIISLLFEEKNLNFWTTMKNGLKRVFPYIGVILLLGFIMSPIALLYLPPFYKKLYGQDLGAIWSVSIYIVGIIYSIIALVIVLPKLYPSLFLICIPKKGLVEALKESWHLMPGNNLRAIFYTIVLLGYEHVLEQIYNAQTLTLNTHIPALILGTAVYIFLLQPATFVWVAVINDFRQRQPQKQVNAR